MSLRKELLGDREFVCHFFNGRGYYRPRLNILYWRYVANSVFVSSLPRLSLLEGLALRGAIEFGSTPLLFKYLGLCSFRCSGSLG